MAAAPTPGRWKLSKIIVITGAGTGLGRALARRLTADGETVALMGRRLSKIAAVADELGARAFAVQCDVSSPDSVRSAFAAVAERHGRIDVLINNAGVFHPFLVAEGGDDEILTTIATNLTGPILCARAAIPLMGRGGHIINVSSEVVADHRPYFTLYQCSKAGLERFSLSLGLELAASGIRVTTVRAGQMVEADMTWDIDPALAARFAAATLAAGLDLRTSPKSSFTSAAEIFRAVIDLPADLTAEIVTLRARAP